jgi:hypothetical protein
MDTFHLEGPGDCKEAMVEARGEEEADQSRAVHRTRQAMLPGIHRGRSDSEENGAHDSEDDSEAVRHGVHHLGEDEVPTEVSLDLLLGPSGAKG